MSQSLIVVCHGDKDEEGHLSELGTDQSLCLGRLLAAKGLTPRRAACCGIPLTLDTVSDVLCGAGIKRLDITQIRALLDDKPHHPEQSIEIRAAAYKTLGAAPLQAYLTLDQETKAAMTSYGLVAAQNLDNFLGSKNADVILIAIHAVYANAMLWARYQGKMGNEMDNRLLTDPPLQPATGYIIHEDATGNLVNMEPIRWKMRLPKV